MSRGEAEEHWGLMTEEGEWGEKVGDQVRHREREKRDRKKRIL